jgi:hypothetical protein
MRTVVIAKSKGALSRFSGRGGQKCHSPGRVIPSSQPFDAGKCLAERLGEMGFVEQEQAIGTQEPSVDGLHPIAYAIAAEQNARANLIDR